MASKGPRVLDPPADEASKTGIFLEEAEKNHEVWDDVTALQLDFSSNGAAFSVDFMGFCLWSSEGEGIPYDQEDKPLPWVPYFKSLMATRLGRASQLKQRLF